MGNNATVGGSRFREVLAGWVMAEAAEKGVLATVDAIGGDNDQVEDAFNELWRLIEVESVDRVDIIQAVLDLYTPDSTWLIKKSLIVFMMTLVSLQGAAHPGYSVPEFFWIVLGSNVLFEVTDISDIATISELLQMTGGTEILRGYLVATLLSGDIAKRPNAVRAFYPVGHTISTLKVTHRVLANDLDVSLLSLLYQHALFLVPQDGLLPFSNPEKSYLYDFFTRGLSIPDPRIIEACREALKRLI